MATRLYGVLLIIALVVVSGVIAYIGDIVGRRMGRKRLSLLGLRPRHTAIAISVVAGMLITVFTLGAAMAISENVRLGFLRVDALRTELRQLRPEHGRLLQETETLTARAKQLEQERAQADAEIAAQHAEIEEQGTVLRETENTLGKTTQALKQARLDLASVTKSRERAEAAAFDAARDVLRLKRTRDELIRANTQLLATAAQARGNPFVLEAGQPLDMTLIASGLTLPQIRERLYDLVARVDKAVREVGASPAPSSKQAVLIWHTVAQDPKTGEWAWVPGETVLNGLAREIQQGSAKDGVAVRAVSQVNTYEGEPVPIDFEVFLNVLVFTKGTKLGEVVIGEELPDDEIYDSLVILLRDQVGPRGRGRVMPLLKPGSLRGYSRGREYVGDISSKDLFATVEKVKQIRGRAHVTAVAKEDTWTVGPLKVALKVEPI